MVSTIDDTAFFTEVTEAILSQEVYIYIYCVLVFLSVSSVVNPFAKFPYFRAFIIARGKRQDKALRRDRNF